MKKSFFAVLCAVAIAGVAQASQASGYSASIGWVDGDESYGKVVPVACPSFQEVVVGLNQRLRVQCDKKGVPSVTNLVRGAQGEFVPASMIYVGHKAKSGNAEGALRDLRDAAEATLMPQVLFFKAD